MYKRYLFFRGLLAFRTFYLNEFSPGLIILILLDNINKRLSEQSCVVEFFLLVLENIPRQGLQTLVDGARDSPA